MTPLQPLQMSRPYVMTPFVEELSDEKFESSLTPKSSASHFLVVE